MAKCTGIRCLMQVGYKVDECNHKDCPYRTEPMTNADKIRTMSDEELKEFICSNLQCKFCKFERWGRCELLEWLQQPVKENDYD